MFTSERWIYELETRIQQSEKNEQPMSESFLLDQLEQSQKWIKRFNQYKIVFRLKVKPEETQMDTLGVTKQKISSLHSDSSRKIWKTLVKAKFDKHFMAGTNI